MIRQTAIITTVFFFCSSIASAFMEPLASFEPAETDLIVTTAAHDSGLSVSYIQGGANGVPSATDGDYVLKLDIAGEDGKVEFALQWNSTSYHLAGRDTLLADVYVETSSVIPGIIGIIDSYWEPPYIWEAASDIPTSVGTWTTISFDVSSREQVGLRRIHALVLENMPGASGVIYIDNLRFSGTGSSDVSPEDLATNAFEDRYEMVWRGFRSNNGPGFAGYNIWRAPSQSGPFSLVNDSPVLEEFYSDPVDDGAPLYYYRVTALIDGTDTSPTNTESAQYNGFTDEALLDALQQAAFGYFWDYGHPTCGAARETYKGWGETIASGGTGMGMMAICVGAERGFVSRSDAATRVLDIINFLEGADRYNGVWGHWINGSTGQTIPFSQYDDGADLVETSYVAQGLLTVRQYFDDETDSTEIAIRQKATQLWQEIDWTWHRRYSDSPFLYWHWSPNYDWQMDLPIPAYSECMITYIMAIASPSHPVPASMYTTGWTNSWGYANGKEFYGIPLTVGPDYGGPMFFTHYTHLGLDPRFKRDDYCNYYDNSRAISLIHQAYAIDNPQDFEGYNRWSWGMTASTSPPPWYYAFHCPTWDNGTITPTAAISAIPYTPKESLETIRYFLDKTGSELRGPYGFYDAFNHSENWFSDDYIAIDQGPIVVMIENYRTGLCWDLFMSNPEIKTALYAMGWYYEADINRDMDINSTDTNILTYCLTGPGIEPLPGCEWVDFDNDSDVDLFDYAYYQQAFTAK